MSYVKALQDWANKSDMSDSFKLDEHGIGNVGFRMTLGETEIPVMLRGFEDQKMLALFVFLPFEAKKAKFLDLFQVFNVIQESVPFGRFTLSESGEIVLNQNISLGDIQPDASLVEEMVNRAFATLDFYLDGIAEVALEKLSFKDWKAQLPS